MRSAGKVRIDYLLLQEAKFDVLDMTPLPILSESHPSAQRDMSLRPLHRYMSFTCRYVSLRVVTCRYVSLRVVPRGELARPVTRHTTSTRTRHVHVTPACFGSAQSRTTSTRVTTCPSPSRSR